MYIYIIYIYNIYIYIIKYTYIYIISIGWFPSYTAAYDNIGRCRRQRLVFGILQPSIFLVIISIKRICCIYCVRRINF